MGIPFFGRGVRINLTLRTVCFENLEERLYLDFIGGKGLGALLLYNNLPAGIDPLSPDNIMIFLTGPLTGSGFPGSSRGTVVTRSPLTGAFLDSSIGGGFGSALKRAGVDYFLIEGKATAPTWLMVNNEHIEFRDASELWGLPTSKTVARIKKEIDDDRAEVLAIGPGGERGILFASATCGGRMFGRGGSGTVMGSKLLKAISITGSNDLPWCRSTSFKDQIRKIREKIQLHPLTKKDGPFPRYGTTFTTEVTQTSGVLPTLNWQESVFKGAEKIFSEAFFEKKVASRTCLHCPIGCASIVSLDNIGPSITARRPEYETIYAFGSNCGIDDPETIVHANSLCEEYGLDTISCGVVISFVMECSQRGILDNASGLCIQFGDRDGLLETIRHIGENDRIGRLLGRGVKRLSEEIGSETNRFAMCVKGLELPGYDPRGMKAMALLYATSDRGGCHVRGSSLRSELLGLPKPIDRFGYEGKPALVVELQRISSLMNSYSQCLFAGFGLTLEDHVTVLASLLNKPITSQDLLSVAGRIWNLTRLFNYREGFSREDDTLPARLFEDPIPSGPSKGEFINRRHFEAMKDEYYELQGWDKKTGKPLLDMSQYMSRNSL